MKTNQKLKNNKTNAQNAVWVSQLRRRVMDISYNCTAIPGDKSSLFLSVFFEVFVSFSVLTIYVKHY